MRSSYLLVNQSQSDIQANQSQSDIRINRNRFDIWVPRIQSNIRNATSIATPEYSGETTSLTGRKTASTATPANLASDYSAYCLGNQHSGNHLH